MRLIPLLLAGLLSTGLRAQTPADCPPQPQPPTPEQIQQAQAQATDRGALWKLSKDGRQSYLYGTIHIGRFEWLFPGPNLQKAMRETAVLAVEVDITAPGMAAALQQAQAEAAAIPLGEKEQARLDAQADAACLPRAALGSLHPIMQAITYVSLAGRRDGLQPGFGQEIGLIGGARALQRPVVELESLQQQLAVLLPRDAAKARSLFDQTLVTLERREAAGSLQRLSEAWLKGDLATLGSPEKLCNCTPTAEELAFQRQLNDGRNPHLADRIAEEHAKGKPVLAAVGLLHMTGDQALPKLLAARGFQVERLH